MNLTVGYLMIIINMHCILILVTSVSRIFSRAKIWPEFNSLGENACQFIVIQILEEIFDESMRFGKKKN